MQEEPTKQDTFERQPDELPRVEPQGSPVVTAPIETDRPGRRKRLTIILASVLAVLVVAAGGAAAYFGYVVPNKPENILKKAADNFLVTSTSHSSGKVSISGDGNAVTVDFTSKADAEKKVAELALEVKMSGVSVPLEVRYVDESVYVRLGDISTLQSILSTYASSYGVDSAAVSQIFAILEDEVVDKWIEIDESVIAQSDEAKCVVDSDWKFTDDDVSLIKSAYEKNQFITVKSHSEDKVNDRDSIKYELAFDNEKAKQFGTDESLEQLSAVKTLIECAGATKDEDTPSEIEDLENADYTVTVWVDKADKRFNKFAVQTKSDDVTADVEAFITYEAVTVDKPEDVTPVMELFAKLQQAFGELYAPGQDTITTFEESDVSFN